MRSTVTFELKGHLNTPGFRPYIWKMAAEARLGGWVAETPGGASLRLIGEDEAIGEFIRALPVKLPRTFHLTAIRLVQKTPAPPIPPEGSPVFRLLGPALYSSGIEADRAPCPECVRKMLDPESRFYHYPFVSCRNCGPRYSIATMAPFSRRNSAFMAFPPCKLCAAEANADADGNPNQTCPFCGPSALLMNSSGEIVDSYSPLETACEKLQQGGIISVKTYDGFITLCDALNSAAVAELRRRKQLQDKPVSVMVRDLEIARKYCVCSDLEAGALSSPAAPVVILKRREKIPLDETLFCPDFPETLGLALPPTAMLRLLFESRPTPDSLQGQFDAFAFVGGPKPVDPDDAGGDEDFFANAHYSDYVLTHDLKIWQNGGSSVQQESEGKILTRRRSRGICPTPLKLKDPLLRVALALGSDRSAAVALGYRDNVAVSQQMGTISSDRNARSLSLVGERFLLLYAQVPDIVVCDMDINALSASEALRFSERYGIPLATAQRHHANAIACMVEHSLDESLALVLDGGAYGPDGVTWGAELLEVTFTAFRRLATFNQMRTQQIRGDGTFPGPADHLFSILETRQLEVTDPLLRHLGLSREEYENGRTKRMEGEELEKTHAALPFFEAISAVFPPFRKRQTYDIQILVQMEAAISRGASRENAERLSARFPFTLRNDDGITVVDWTETFRNLQDPGWISGEKAGDLQLGFFLSVSRALAEMAEDGAQKTGRKTIVLSGSVFYNLTLMRLTRQELEKRAFRVYTHEQTAPDQSSVCIGQAVFGGMS